jgi:hypothetical protein
VSLGRDILSIRERNQYKKEKLKTNQSLIYNKNKFKIIFLGKINQEYGNCIIN